MIIKLLIITQNKTVLTLNHILYKIYNDCRTTSDRHNLNGGE